MVRSNMYSLFVRFYFGTKNKEVHIMETGIIVAVMAAIVVAAGIYAWYISRD